MSNNNVLLLFDIDGTLLDSSGAGGGALLAALQSEFNLEHVAPVPLHGRTDLGIMSELLDGHGIPATEDNILQLSESYFRRLPEVLLQRRGTLLPGVLALLQRLQDFSQCRLAILTGNMPESAKIKLVHYELWDYFEFGIYGDLAPERPALAEPAKKEIRSRLNLEPRHDNVVIIGDTTLDVALAQRMGVRSLAVCTGGFEEEALADAGASLVAKDLTATQELTYWLLREGES